MSVRIGLRLASGRVAIKASVHRPIVVFLTTTDWPLLPLSVHSFQPPGATQ